MGRPDPVQLRAPLIRAATLIDRQSSCPATYPERPAPRDQPIGSRLHPLPWIERAPCAAYFVNEAGVPWTPVGQNDAVTWPEFAGLYRRRDLAAVERHLRHLRDQGVTCLRLMLEYCHREHRYLERPVGRFVPAMVRLWDDLIVLCRTVGMRVLLTPFDTFFTWVRWRFHPYNQANGGPCASRRALLT